LKIAPSRRAVQHAVLAHSHKRKTRATGAQTALLVSAVLTAGGVASFLCVHFASSKGSLPANLSPPAGSNQVVAETNEATPNLSKWLPTQTNAADLINVGTVLLEKGQNHDSVLCFRRALELSPDDEEIHFNLGIAYSRLGELDAAAQQYREALKLVPDYTEAHNNLGNVLTRQRRFAQAIGEFEAALKVSPDNPLAHNNLGRVLAEQGKPDEAVPHFAEALRLDPDYAEAQFNLGSSYLTMGRTNDAVAALNATLRIRPDFPPALQLLARLRGSR
jgi:Flp pilus assembly protein TadD